jgi:hypothetical protein
MKSTLLCAIAAILLVSACGEAAENDSFRDQIDSAKKALAGEDYSVQTYATDSSKHWRIFTTTTQKKESGKFTTAIEVEFLQQGKMVAKSRNPFLNKVYPFGQVIAVDEPAKVSLYYLVKDEQDVKSIFQVTYAKGGEAKFQEVDKANMKEWERINTLIEDNND